MTLIVSAQSERKELPIAEQAKAKGTMQFTAYIITAKGTMSITKALWYATQDRDGNGQQPPPAHNW